MMKKSINQILNQILNTAYLSVQNSNTQPGLFLDKIKSHI